MHAPILLALALAASPAPPRTFRVDAFHTGNATEKRFSLDRLVVEPLPFPGNPDRPLDELNIGKYLFEVRDLATNRLLYSRGYATIFGEWETTAEAKEVNRTFHESLRFPAPGGPVQVVVRKRARELQEKRKAIRKRNGPESEMDALFLTQKKEESARLSAETHAGQSGAFEGANYEAKGSYRSQVDCVMFSRNDVPFCSACRSALGDVIDQYTGAKP
jgi:hypothetical protein